MARVGVHRCVGSTHGVELAGALHFEALAHFGLTLLHVHLLDYFAVGDPGR